LVLLNLTINSAVVPLLSTVIEPQQRASMFGVNAAASTAIGFFGSLLGGSLPGLLAPWLGVAATDERAYRSALFASVLFGLLAVVPLIGIKRAARGMSQQTINPNMVMQDKPNVSFARLFLFATPSIFLALPVGCLCHFKTCIFVSNSMNRIV
jgi:MFS family permease